MGKLSHKNLFRVGLVRQVAIALVLAVSLSLISTPPAAAVGLEDFEITYEISLSTNVIYGDEVFEATIKGKARCKKDLPFPYSLVTKVEITSYIIAKHNGTEKSLSDSYTVTIQPFPKKEGDVFEIKEMVIPLQFPASSESGNYDVLGKLDEAKAYPGGIDVSSYLPQTQFMGSVEYIAPEDEPPTIAYSPSSFSFTATEGGANPPGQILSIWNSGGGTLNWSVSHDATWLTLTPTSGTSTSWTGYVTLSVDISGMSAGSYSATITISAPGATNQTVPVSLVITESTCTLTMYVSPSGSGTTIPGVGSHSYDAGTVVNLSATPASGWAFDHWSGTNNNAINPTTVTMNSNKSVTAYFDEIPPTQYSLTLNISGQGTTNPSPGSHAYNQGTEVTITAYPASGWAFDHWSGTSNNYINPTTVTMNSNKSVTAYFDEAVADISSYYRGLDGDPTNVSDEDLLQAAYDWAHHVIPNGFDQWLSDIELLQLAKEWATNTPQMVPASLTIMGEDTTLHIANIDMGLTSTWWGWRTYAIVTVSIADAQGNPVADAIVSGHWEGATPDIDSGGTDSQGRVKLSSNAVWEASGTRFTFTVDEVTKAGWTYNPDDNTETTDSIVKESGGFFSSIWLLLKSFIQSLRSMFSEVISYSSKLLSH